MDRFVALAFSGLALGAIVALMALGFLILYKTTGVINFAHGDLATLGGYVAFSAITAYHLPTVAGYAVAVLVLFVVGIVLERLALAPLRRRPHLEVVLATLAAAIALRALIGIWQGSTPQSLPSPVGNGTVSIAGVAVSNHRVLIILTVAVVAALMLYVLQRTPLGRNIRAVATDPETAMLQGVRVRRIGMIAFGLSAACAALAGVLAAPMSALSLDFGFVLMLTAFAAAVVGGFGSVAGVLAAAVILGVAQQLIGGYVAPNFASVVPYLVILGVIAVRPGGLVSTGRSRL